jgi:NitT/TauT family transport system substrate-binding protein
MYGSSTVDAVCITNMDILACSLSRDSVAVLPTSTSDGADAVIVTGINSVDELSSVASYGLEKSVSQYMFERNLEDMGKDPANFQFKNMDPAAAAQAMQTKQENIQSIVVWNPFVLQTLRTRDGSKVLFDSTTIPGEIIDMVVIAKTSLEQDGGANFACAVIETFYKVNELLADSEKGDATLVALGEKFSSLPLEDMKIVVEQTKFYKSADEALGLFSSETFRNETMPKVVDFCATHDIVDSKPVVGFDSATAQLNFDTQYIKKVQSQP